MEKENKNWFQKLKKYMENSIDYIYPRKCPLCQKLTKGHCLICEECREQVPYIEEPYCMKCGKPFYEEERTKEYCYDCNRYQRSFVRSYSLLRYEGMVKKSMYQFKYYNKREFADWYAKELVRRYEREWTRVQIDCIIPVPIHKRKKRQRGYNQAEVLAKRIAKLLEIPCYPNGLIRVIETRPQKELDNKDRYRNLKQAFRIGTLGKEQELKTVLLIDDIYTTGATLEACTQVLLESGRTKRVYGCTVCSGRGM